MGDEPIQGSLASINHSILSACAVSRVVDMYGSIDFPYQVQMPDDGTLRYGRLPCSPVNMHRISPHKR